MILKTILGVILFSVWAFFAYRGLTPVDAFITGIRDALISLGVFHATLQDPKKAIPPPVIAQEPVQPDPKTQNKPEN